MAFRRIARCPVCHEQIDVLETPTKESSGMGEAMILGDSRRIHGVKSPKCVGERDWSKGWDLDDFVEIPDRPAPPVVKFCRGNLHITWEYRVPDVVGEDVKTELDHHATERALEMVAQGYREGELHITISGVDYSGWWRNQS